MGTYYTNTRKLKFPWWVGRYTYGPGPGQFLTGDVYYGQAGSPVSKPLEQLLQTTTSYRSGGSVDSASLTNDQILQSAELAGRKELFPYDTGHEFQTENYKVLCDNRVRTIQGIGYNVWEGNVAIGAFATYGFNPLAPGDLNVIGAQAINLTAPTKPSTSTAEFLAQLKSGQELPELSAGARPFLNANWFTNATSLQEAVRNFLSFGGKSYLNLEFGWVPFVNDIQSIAAAVKKSQKIVEQYARDSGRPVRRKYRFPDIIDTTVNCEETPLVLLQNSGVQTLNYLRSGGDLSSVWGDIVGQYSSVTSVRTQRWFSGEYMYHLADRDNLLGKFRYYASLAEKLTGYGITPIALWDLAPWSWLADWFADFSTVISNGSLFSDPNTNLVLRYGYMMEQIDSVVTDVCTGTVLNGYHIGNLRTSVQHTLKRRVQATPFGFGLDTQSFSDYQWSILAALGLLSGASSLHRL